MGSSAVSMSMVRGPADEDYGDKRIVPGFIDIHTHGAYDFDTNDGQPEGLRNWMKRIPEEGVTAIPAHHRDPDAGCAHQGPWPMWRPW